MAKRKLDALTARELRKELQKRQGRAQDLEKRRDQLVSDIEGIDQELEELGVTSTGASRGRTTTSRRRGPGRPKKKRGPGRPRGSRTRGAGNRTRLSDTIASILSDGRPRRVTEIVQEVLQQGYTSRSKNFSNIVSQALSNDGRFEKLGRGQYGLKQQEGTSG